jgi:para-nitrobenzyl esterase
MPWKGIRDAGVFMPCAIQQGSLPGSFYHKEFFHDEDYLPPMSEDCLYLNIWTPAATAAEKLPVAFWIHGGAFINGFASEMEFDGAAFNEQGVILVTAGHRLGALGHLAHPWLSAESGGMSGNYGLYDLVFALDWVRDNIDAFGGDPEKITLFGQSAGAVSTQILISSKLTKGKIRSAVIQSGGGYRSIITNAAPLAQAEEKGDIFVKRCKAKSLEDLRAVGAEDLIAPQMECFNESRGKGRFFGPVIDGELLEDTPDAILEQGKHLDIPYMIGCTANDIGGSAERESPLKKICMDFSQLNEKLGRKPSYVYYFTRRPLGDDAGSFHSAELWYVFGTLGRSWRPKTPEDYALSQTMVRRWCNFIINGSPNGAGLPDWKPCSAADPFVMEFA